MYDLICNKNTKRNLEILVLQKQRQDAEICVFPQKVGMQNTSHAKKEENLAYMHQSNGLFIFLNSKYLILLKRKQQNG